MPTPNPSRRVHVALKGIRSFQKTHGMSRTREYKAWSSMLTRCFNQNHPSFKNYGGIGIVVCSEWRDGFAQFYTDMGPCPPGLTLERKDVRRGYEPSNCIWADYETQQNNKRNSRRITIGDRSMTVSRWSRLTGVPINTITRRLASGYPIDTILAARKFSKHDQLRGSV